MCNSLCACIHITPPICYLFHEHFSDSGKYPQNPACSWFGVLCFTIDNV